MTSHLRTLIDKIFGKNETYRGLIVGLDAAGKTTILYRLVLGEIVTTIPTIGFNVETFVYRKHTFTLWDVGGCDKIRPLFRHYLPGTNAIIFIIDGNDRERIPEAKDLLWYLISCEESKAISLLIFLNKMDMPEAMTTHEVQSCLGLNALRGTSWFIQACSASSGDGLYQGFDRLITMLDSNSSEPLNHLHQSMILTGDRNHNENEDHNIVHWLDMEDQDTAEQYVEKFCAHENFTTRFDHRSIIRIIWSSLQLLGRKQTIKTIDDHIRFYLPEMNETLIYFWIQIVHYARQSEKVSSTNFSEFLVRNPQLLNEQSLPLTYYRSTTLNNDKAKSSVVLPDLKPLPNIIVNEKLETTASSSSNPHMNDREDSINMLHDDQFLEQFESCSLTSWSHKTHLRMAWLYLTRYGRRDGVNRIFNGIKNFIDQSPIARKTTFHFTMTYFWIQMIDLAIASTDANLDFEKFIQSNSHLMNGGLFLDYYQKETMLNNPRARVEFVLPDKKPLPTLVVSKK